MKRNLAHLAPFAAIATLVFGARTSQSAPPPPPSDLHASIAKPAPGAGATPSDALISGGGCPGDMVLVEGDYCSGTVEHACAKWVDGQPARDRCAEYKPTSRCFGRMVHERFCVDRYEYPNKVGVKPTTGVTWEEARDQCKAGGKRLCKDQEWTLACEGPERLPYPSGYVRDASTCNYDRPYIQPNNDRYADVATRDKEFSRLDQRVASGERSACVSAFGVHDMTGNVDEWVVNDHGKIDDKPYISGLKGGWWGPVRNRCRPMTVDHNQWHVGWAIGFRCCEDAR